MIRQLRFLLEICFLSEIDLEKEKIAKILENTEKYKKLMNQ